MRRKPLRILWLGLIVAMTVLLLAFATQGLVAHPRCPSVHEVVHGETIESVAAQYGISVAELKHLNRLGPRTKLWPGRRLCLPAAVGMSEPTPPSEAELLPEQTVAPASTFDLVIEFKLAQDRTFLSEWEHSRQGLVGNRVRFAIPDGDAIVSVATLSEVLDARALEVQPDRFWLARSEGNATGGYLLVLFEDIEPLQQLALDADHAPITPTEGVTVSVSNLFTSTDILDVSLRGELVVDDGLFLPFPIDAVVYYQEPPDFLGENEHPAFSIHGPTGAGLATYRLVTVINEEGVGPPGNGWRNRCSRWGGGGWRSRLLRRVYRC